MPGKLFDSLMCACLLVVAGWQTSAAQPAPERPKPQFDVASVKPSQAAVDNRAMAMAHLFEMMPAGVLMMPDPGRLHIEGWPLRHLIAAAYRVRDDRVVGPPWMEERRFDIEAKLPEGAKADDAHEMLQSLLAERFGLELHRETRPQPGFALMVGKSGAKLEAFVPPTVAPTESVTAEELQERQRQQAEQRSKAMQQQMRSGPRRPGMSRSSWQGMTTTDFADRLGPMVGGPVADETGLSGKYRFVVETWRATDDDPGQTVFEAVEQLGLKLVPRKASVEVLVIDKASKTPSDN